MRSRLAAVAVVGLIGGLLPGQAQAQGIDWVREFGSHGPDFGRAVAADATGTYVVGVARKQLPFETYQAGFDGFIRKYSPTGKRLWTDEFGTTGQDGAADVAVDSSGVYVVGWIDGSGGLPSLPNEGPQTLGDALIRKYTLGGQLVWTHRFGPPHGGAALSVALSSDAVYVSGFTIGTFAGELSRGGGDGFVAKFALNGTQRWARQFGSPALDVAEGVAVNDTGVYVSGHTDGAIDAQTSQGNTDAFVRKYDSEGLKRWTRQFGTSGLDFAESVAVQGTTGVFVTGESGSESRTPGLGTVQAFVHAFGVTGTDLWNRTFGTPKGTDASDIVVGSDSLYVTGGTEGALQGQTAAGKEDAYVRAFGFDGTAARIEQCGTPAWDEGGGVAVDPSGMLEVAGGTLGIFPREKRQGSEMDAFVARLSPP
ncbi:MAG: hypothetical protein M3O84_03265 [Actinomycetota bacterium]|nr:hypothetical protein [Actinomycetota bacterium]